MHSTPYSHLIITQGVLVDCFPLKVVDGMISLNHIRHEAPFCKDDSQLIEEEKKGTINNHSLKPLFQRHHILGELPPSETSPP